MSFTETLQRRRDDRGLLWLLELTAPSFSGPAYLASDNRDWVSNGRTYVGVPFGFHLPNAVAGESPRLQFTLANAGRGWSEELERLQPNELVMAKFMLADKRTPDRIERSWVVRLAGASITGARASTQGGYDAMDRQPSVLVRATPHTLPGLF